MEENKPEKKGGELKRAIFKTIGGVVFICVMIVLFVLIAYHRSEIRIEYQQKYFFFTVFAILGGLVMVFGGIVDIIDAVKKAKKKNDEDKNIDDKK